MKSNSKNSLSMWVMDALCDSKGLSSKLKAELFNIAKIEIRNGGLRGSISDKWQEHSPLVTQLTIKDLYV